MMGVHVYCHYSKVHYDSEVKDPLGSSLGQINLYKIIYIQ